MAKTKRLVFDNACCHVMVRGNRKQNVFVDESGYTKYRKILMHYKRKHKLRLYAYCLMPNHVHLIFHIKAATSLSKAMLGLNLSYAKWFNKKYEKVGHLWQGRYKSMVIQNNDYLLDCIQYVELNPVRAGICKSAFEYFWSSSQERLGHSKPELLDALDSA